MCGIYQLVCKAGLADLNRKNSMPRQAKVYQDIICTTVLFSDLAFSHVDSNEPISASIPSPKISGEMHFLPQVIFSEDEITSKIYPK